MTDIASSDVSVSLVPRDREVVTGTKILSLAEITFGDGALTYPAGGVPLPGIGQFGLKREIQRLFIQQPHTDGRIYKFDPDNYKIKIMAAGERGNAGATYAVVHAGTPGGNAVYLKFASDGLPYLCCNMATDTADKVLDIGGYKVIVVHDASASDGIQVYFDEDGAAGAQLLTDNTVNGGADVYVPTNVPGYFLKVNHDGSASSNGVTLNYDDGDDDQLEATFAGTADVDLILSAYGAGELAELPAGTAPAEVTLPVLVVGE